MEYFWVQQMKLDTLTQLGWGDVADYCRQRDKKYQMSKFMGPAAIKPQTEKVSAISTPTSCGEHLEALVIIAG